MAGGDEMRRHRSADIAGCACAEDFHGAYPLPSLRATGSRECAPDGSQ
jgi:hypothetical protein